MVDFAGEQPYDERHHSTAEHERHDNDQVRVPGYAGAPGEFFTPPTYREAPSYYMGLPVDTDKMPLTVALVSTGLVWRSAPGQEVQDIGRLTRDQTEEMHTLDLRVMLAHLDSAATTIKAELEGR